jgi:hypothetical protein
MPTLPKDQKPSADPAAHREAWPHHRPLLPDHLRTRTRFAISWYRGGKRMRQVFHTLEAAKQEALVVAR